MTAALGTLHGGEPFVSMVPFSLLPDGAAFVIHVSHLASHTKDMLQHSSVSLMVTASAAPDIAPQALPRVTIQANAAVCEESEPDYEGAKAAYIAKFPQAADLFDFGDFELFLLTPHAARYIGGFARAADVTAKNLIRALRTEAKSAA
jgi:putative heme iron utilization protein